FSPPATGIATLTGRAWTCFAPGSPRRLLAMAASGTSESGPGDAGQPLLRHARLRSGRLISSAPDPTDTRRSGRRIAPSVMPNRHAKQKDLFGPAAVPGLSFFDECLSAAEERALIARIDGLALAPFRFQGWLGKRLTLAFGWSYDFDHGALALAEPIPDWLLPLRD